MATAKITSLELTEFKSFRNQSLPLDDLTILTGRNSSGKSNALDGLEVLSRLAAGEDIGDALDGRRRERGAVRGGSAGCARHGRDHFYLGCKVDLDGDRYHYRVKIRVRPELRIIGESLSGPAPAVKSGTIAVRDLLSARTPGDNSMGIEAEIYNGKQGGNPAMTFRDTRLILTQLPVRISPRNSADRAVLRAADAVASALKGVFHLDPIPHLMRSYVPERDVELRRTGENISAAIANLKMAHPDRYAQVLELVREIADSRIRDIRVEPSNLGDVMLALEEGEHDPDVTPAREMSDGLLRFLAIATALLTTQHGLDIDTEDDVSSVPGGPPPVDGAVAIVVEEIENGLHPSQADRVLDLIRRSSTELGTRVLVTTHSPALLNVATGSRNKNVVVCYRDPNSGDSQLRRLTDLPGYAEALAQGKIGDLVSRDRLVRPESPRDDWSGFDEIIGLR